ncbi:ribbon-helix-helix domain-containing protein [Spirulina subsalsa FACHB-351]|uniref:Ribbon-helix-helix domain-containing protein n=1 Tax=Spirulina subsalsa FACHB-351 TaxID=234711 RepID=A0ABT3L3H0_9CYAN|nr:ribbon-helix-helix domain-containing protein [Spirulina subsalsa]MCW6036058.1 ribbon-helix-helix domain-containing protein [Spirulina subsalsa FACHB-351]
MTLKNIGVKLPEDWLAEVDDFAQRHGLTRNDVMKMAIAQFLGKTKKSSTDEKLEKLARAVTKLNGKITSLNDKVNDLEQQTVVHVLPPEPISPPKQIPPASSRRLPSIPLDARAQQIGLSPQELLDLCPWLSPWEDR